MTLHEWTKRLGQRHWSKSNEPETLCGRPMLGNNYADRIPDSEKQDCEECARRKSDVDANSVSV